ncbi:MAG: aspartate carbamoyltransferase [Thaumarchaeota archaeon]|nr:aspartate carbamoyltransferase [Nitrososphaerota archaeon]
MTNPFFGRDLISIRDVDRSQFELLFSFADKLESLSYSKKQVIASGKILGTMFFEPSTRTRLSFEAAMLSIGGGQVGVQDPKTSSIEKGENLADTIRTMDCYVDVLVIRHPMEGAARFAAEISSKPVINAGTGSEEHPTQAMLDLYTIIKESGAIDGMKIGIIGDLKYGRAVHSLLYALARYKPRVYLISPPSLNLRKEVIRDLEPTLSLSEHETLEEVIEELDVLYVTRIQKERIPDPQEYEQLRGSYVVDSKILEKAKSNAIILHPLPRTSEIRPEVDKTKNARYFKQPYWGKLIRSALLGLILNDEVKTKF